MIGTLAQQITASVAERPPDTDSPCVYHRAGSCASERKPMCPYCAAGACLVAGRVGVLGQRGYKGGPPEMAEEVGDE